MTTSFVTVSLPISVPDPAKKKKILLVDMCTSKRELRATAMRQLGIDVDCAGDIAEARCWWRAALYDLVILNVQNDRGHRDKFCADLRDATPPQPMAFLVGKPEYLSIAPGPDEMAPDESRADQAQVSAPPSEEANVSSSPVAWGIMEASRRISAVRSLSALRSAAHRNRPTPPRDLEMRHAHRDEAEFRISPLQKEELS